MSETSPANTLSQPLVVARLAQRKPTRFALEPAAEARVKLAEDLDVPAIEELRFNGQIQPAGKTDWVLQGQLTARVVQDCVVTGDPVATRISENVTRRFLETMPELVEEEGEVVMPEDETIEPLERTIDPGQVMQEALALALPLYPRKKGAGLGSVTVTEPGAEPLTDEAVKPFASLAGLREKMKK
jgi:uncharacterized metal-binding protein YceD (DUF177 family)